MSFQGHGTDISLPAGADLRAKQFTFVKVNSSGAIVAAGAGEFAIGILQNKPNSGEAATVRVAGISKLVSGTTVTAGAVVASDANGAGKAVTVGATTGSNVLAVALETSAASGNLIAVQIEKAGAIPTTAA